MSFDLLKHIMLEVGKEDITQITVSGFGETFIDKDAIKKIEYISNLGYDLNILTNGTLLTKDIIDAIFNLVVKNFRISVHATIEDKFNDITQTKNFNKLMVNLEYASTKRNGVTELIATNVVECEDEVPPIKKVLEPLVDILEVWKPHNWGSTLDYRNGEKLKITCGRPIRGPLQVQVDGTVNMCCFDYNGILLLGDLKTQSIKEIFSSQAYLDLLERHKSGKHNSLCMECDQRLQYDGLLYSSLDKTVEERENMFSSSHENMK